MADTKKKAQGAGETRFAQPAPTPQANAATKLHVQQFVKQLPDNTAGPEKKPEKASEIIPLDDEDFQDF